MKRLLLFLALSVVSFAKAATAPDGIEAFLDGFVAKFSKSDVDFFYVSPAQKGQHCDFVYIYWMTGNSILIVDVPTERLVDYWWYDYKARVRLGSDVVPTQDNIQGSTYLTDAGWVENRLKECLAGGRKIVVKRPNQSPEPTAMLVTPRAEPRVAPSTAVAHL